ncbi:MAG: FG-GAP-like repeat-containing protein [Planctomycetota bacterium]
MRSPLCLAFLAGSLSAQTPGVVDWDPTPPPTASWPVFVDIGDQVGAPGTDFKDIGSGRGQAWVDVVGPDPSDPGNPLKVGGPDGVLDLVQANSNSPGMPIGLPPMFWTVPEIGTQQAPCLLLRREASGQFVDVAGVLSAGSPEGFNMQYPGGSPWGVTSADYDGDGDSDLFYPCGGFNCASPNALMRNGGDGTFENVGASAGLVGTQPTFSAAWFDADLDGDLDLYVANAGGLLDNFFTGPDPDPTDRLYRNDGAGGLTDVAVQSGTNLKSSSFSVATGDLDLDGDTDLVVSCFMQICKAFYNRGDGTFSFMTPEQNPSWSFALDDLMVDPTVPANPPAEDFQSLLPGMSDTLPVLPHWSMPVELADFNGDRWLDVAFVGWASQLADDDPESAFGAFFTHAERSYLYLNRGDQDGDGVGDGEFREAAVEIGFEHIGGAMGMVVGDYNGDGFPDVYVGGGGPDLDSQLEEDYLYINEPTAWPADFQQDPDQPLSQALYEIGALAGVYGNTFMCHGLTAVREGERVDVLVGNGGPAIYDDGQANVYYANTGNADGQPYGLLDVVLQATRSAPGAIGARVEVIRDGAGGAGQVLVREQSGGARFASHNTGPLSFGMGQGGALFVNVHWESGVRQGQLVWPFTTPDAVTLTEPGLSFALDAVYPAGGGFELSLSASTDVAPGVVGQLLFALLQPAPGGQGFTLAALLPVLGPVAVAPGAPLELASPIGSAGAGLYALALVDTTTFEVLGAGAVWHEPALEGGPAPASYTPPSGAPTSAAVEPRNLAPARRSVIVRADAVELAPARVPVVYEWLDTTGAGERALSGGDVLRWNDGLVTLELHGPHLATLDFRADVPLVTAGRPVTCCELVSATPGVLLRFPGAKSYLVDGVEYAADGRRLTF